MCCASLLDNDDRSPLITLNSAREKKLMPSYSFAAHGLHYVTNVNGTLRKRETSRMAKEIIAYLADHPDAQDTLEGIAEWWLLERKIMGQTKLIREALAELVNDGFIVETKKESTSHYKLNKGKKHRASPRRGTS